MPPAIAPVCEGLGEGDSKGIGIVVGLLVMMDVRRVESVELVEVEVADGIALLELAALKEVILGV